MSIVDPWRYCFARLVAVAWSFLVPVAIAHGVERQGVSRITNAPATILAPEIVRLAIQRVGSNATCTGITLTRRIILTAAHCVQGAMGIRVFYYQSVGTSGTRVFPATNTFGSASFYPHPDFDGSPFLGTNDNDIAVVRLGDPGMSTYQRAKIYFDDRRPWMPNSREDRRVHAFGIGRGSPQGSSSDCDASGITINTKRHADRIYVQSGPLPLEPIKIMASMDGQHLCKGDSGGAWTLKRNDSQGRGHFLVFAIHYSHTEDWWYDTAYGTSIRRFWEWAIGRANDADVSLACPTSVMPGSGYRYKSCRENAMGDECALGQSRHRNCSSNFSGPGVDYRCEGGFWKRSGGWCEPKAPPGGQRP
jgi:hypothetical protein